MVVINHSGRFSKGFTLIEVLVALAILSAGFSVIFQGFKQSELVGDKISKTQTRAMLERSLFTELSRINPAKKQSGRGIQGSVSYHWAAQPISPLLQMKSAGEMLDKYAQMYRIQVVYRLNQKDVSFEFEKIGVQEKLSG